MTNGGVIEVDIPTGKGVEVKKGTLTIKVVIPELAKTGPLVNVLRAFAMGVGKELEKTEGVVSIEVLQALNEAALEFFRLHRVKLILDLK